MHACMSLHVGESVRVRMLACVVMHSRDGRNGGEGGGGERERERESLTHQSGLKTIQRDLLLSKDAYVLDNRY